MYYDFIIKTSRFSESQIVGILKQVETGIAVASICGEHGISSASFYKWCSKYGGMDVSMLKRVKELEAENSRLKKMYTDIQLDQHILKEAMAQQEISNRHILIFISKSLI